MKLKLFNVIILLFPMLAWGALNQRVNALPDREITPSSSLQGTKVITSVDFIYWTLRQEGLSYAQSGNGVNAPRGSVHRPDFSFDPGFKIGIGGHLPHDGWDLFAQYTWISSSVSSRANGNATSGLRPAWNIGGNLDLSSSDIDLSNARASWDVHMHVIDLELGRSFFISRYLILRPYFGLKGAYLDQEYRVRYIPLNPVAIDAQLLRMRMNQDLWGIGLRGGLHSKWVLSNHWHIYGALAISGLWGRFDVDRKDKVQNVAGATFTPVNIRDDFDTTKPILELGAGLGWERNFHQDRYRFSLSAGWELQQWWSQNQFIKLYSPNNLGDFVLHGLTLKARFDF